MCIGYLLQEGLRDLEVQAVVEQEVMIQKEVKITVVILEEMMMERNWIAQGHHGHGHPDAKNQEYFLNFK
ncbi:MAG: hypothetical protein GVY20_06190 [Bacteroidetes bacterium]|jgi:hypothetical protein|nr:hypothetical protein [Bacteroidota bacterium]